MQQAVSSTFKSAEHDPLAEANDLDALGTFLKSWDVPDEEILRTKTLLVSRTFLAVPREDYSDSSAAPVNMVPGEFVPVESLDETLAAKEKTLEGKTAGLEPWPFRATGFRPQADSSRHSCQPGTRILYLVFWQGENQMLHRLGAMLYAPGCRFYVLRACQRFVSRRQIVRDRMQVVREV